jgi:hypothetical protein
METTKRECVQKEKHVDQVLVEDPDSEDELYMSHKAYQILSQNGNDG